MSSHVIDRRLGISEQGNVIEIVTRFGQPQERRLIHKTTGIDRRARKRAAIEWIAERDKSSPAVRNYVTYTVPGIGIIRRVGPLTIRITMMD